jgi:hypothetical protein
VYVVDGPAMYCWLVYGAGAGSAGTGGAGAAGFGSSCVTTWRKFPIMAIIAKKRNITSGLKEGFLVHFV